MYTSACPLILNKLELWYESKKHVLVWKVVYDMEQSSTSYIKSFAFSVNSQWLLTIYWSFTMRQALC